VDDALVMGEFQALASFNGNADRLLQLNTVVIRLLNQSFNVTAPMSSVTM